jgi:toxin HigB-1
LEGVQDCSEAPTVDNTTGWRYYIAVITSFACKETEKFFHGRFSTKLPQDVQRIAQRKLRQLHGAAALDFLRVPPGNKLEQLSGDRSGQWSIRINDQWRICFRWNDGNAQQVEITDYH